MVDRGSRNARPAGAHAGVADGDRPALPAAALPDHAQPADLRGGPSGWRRSCSRWGTGWARTTSPRSPSTTSSTWCSWPSWSTGSPSRDSARRPASSVVSGLARLHRRIFGIVRPGELRTRPASTGQRAFLLAVADRHLRRVHREPPADAFLTWSAPAAALVLVAAQHAARAAGPVRGHPRSAGSASRPWTTGPATCPTSSAASGNLGVQPDQQRRRPADRVARAIHLIALHAREGVAAAIVGMAILGLLRRRRRGFDDRVLLALFCMPRSLDRPAELRRRDGAADLSVPAPGRLRAGRLLLLPRPRSRPGPTGAPCRCWSCAPSVLPVAFFLVRYGNEAFEQIPPGEVAASNWIYAHDATGGPDSVAEFSAHGGQHTRDALVLQGHQQGPVPSRAGTAGPVERLRPGARRCGAPGLALTSISTSTQESYLEQTVGYPAGWGNKFNRRISAAPHVRVAFADSTAVVYTLRWPPGARPRPLPVSKGKPSPTTILSVIGLILLFLLIGDAHGT